VIENIILKNKILSIIIRSSYRSEGIKFFTPNESSLQLGYMSRPEGYEIKPHVHRKVVRKIHFTSEVLFIKSGKVKVDFYDEDNNCFESRILIKGDVIFLAFGGHSFKMLEPTEIIEVKQGPYLSADDKIFLSKTIDEKNKV